MKTGMRKHSVLVAVLAVLMAGFGVTPAAAATGWSIVPTPNPGTTNLIGGVVAFGASDIWAVGSASSSSYSGCHGRTLTLHSTGASFTEVPETPAATPICASVDGVAGVSPTDIWAVGSTNNGRDTNLRHWNGSVWTAVPGATIALPPSGGRQQRSTGLNAVAAHTPGDAWAVGRAQFSDFGRRALAEHWNGSGWSLSSVPVGTGSVLEGVATCAANDVWAVGSATSGSNKVTLVVRWDGAAWSVVASPNANVLNSLHAVAAVPGTNTLWAVGDATKSVTDGVSTMRSLVELWDGSTWSVVPSPNVGTGNNSLAAVVATSPTDVWALGYYDDVTGSIPIRKTLALHWNGTAWSPAATPNAGTGDNWFTEATAAPGGTIWASGVSAAGTLVEKFPG